MNNFDTYITFLNVTLQLLHQKSPVLPYWTNKFYTGADRENRTLDLLITNQLLYHLSYGTNCVNFASAKVRIIFESAKLFVDFLQKIIL